MKIIISISSLSLKLVVDFMALHKSNTLSLDKHCFSFGILERFGDRKDNAITTEINLIFVHYSSFTLQSIVKKISHCNNKGVACGKYYLLPEFIILNFNNPSDTPFFRKLPVYHH